MPQYVVIGSHEPSQCPGANRVMGEVFKKLLEAAPRIAEQHGVRVVMGPVHLDPSHKFLVVLEAPTQDAVQDALLANRIGQVQAVELYRATPVPDLLAKTQGQEPLY
ncbi:MAG TPA: hypothetical protein VFE37_11245 [Chloroflexota bacterium]|nr:hypothetical protein [Chloroflexota bacterium]